MIPCSAPEITSLLRSSRYPVSTELVLQNAIEDRLSAARIDFGREVRLGPADRIDFLAGTVGIEAKTRCAARTIYRQLERYADYDAISALILVTGTALGLPPSINGKPVFMVSLGRSAL